MQIEKEISYTKLFLIFMLGILMLIYPWIAEYVYENQADAIINAYMENIETSCLSGN